MKLPNSLGLRLIATAFAWVAATLVVGGLVNYLIIQLGQSDADRDALRHLDPVASGVLRR